MQASESIYRFCIEKGMSLREAFRFSLAVEELGNNILRWGTVKNKHASMDIRLYENEGWSLRVRDNGGLFDPTKWLEIHNEDDPTHNFGLRLVLKNAKDVFYVNAIKTNNLTVKY